MAWQTTMTTIVRHLIGDLGDTQVYDDSRLEYALAVAGTIAAQEFDLTVDYTFDLDTPDISPDPTLVASADPLAVALFTLKAACLLTFSDYKIASSRAIRIKDGDSEVALGGGLKGYSDIINMGPCASYKKLIEDWYWKSSAKGRAVLGPYSTGNYWSHPRTFFDYFLG